MATILLLLGITTGFLPVAKFYVHQALTPGKPSRVQQKLLEIIQNEGSCQAGYAIGDTTVFNFKGLPDTLKNCGGLCFKVSRERINKAFIEVTGKPLNDWLPASMATPYLSARQVFDWTWGINTQNNDIWRSIPDMRACGSAGAIQLAKLGQIKGVSQIWNGELLPGAVVQVFVYVSDFEKVRQGIDNPKVHENLSSYGHSFIFLEYVKDEYDQITGMKVADQGFLNKEVVTRSMFNIWWGTNILDPK